MTVLMAPTAYLCLAYTLLNKGHIQMTALTDKLKGRAIYINESIIYLIAVLFFAFMTYVTGGEFLKSFIKKEVLGSTVLIPLWIGKIGSFIGCAVMTLQSMLMMIESVVKAIDTSKNNGNSQMNEDYSN